MAALAAGWKIAAFTCLMSHIWDMASRGRGVRERDKAKRDSSTAQADLFTGVKGEEKIGLLRSE